MQSMSVGHLILLCPGHLKLNLRNPGHKKGHESVPGFPCCQISGWDLPPSHFSRRPMVTAETKLELFWLFSLLFFYSRSNTQQRR